MDTPPVPKPRSALPQQNDPLKRPVPLPRTKVHSNNERVSATDILRSISSVSRQLTEDVALKVSSSAKSANEKLEKSISDGSKFAKGTLEKTINTSRAVRDSVTKSVIEGTKTAGLRLRKTKKNENADLPDRCVSMPVVDVSFFDNIQFHSPLLEQKKFNNEDIPQNSQDLPSLNLNASHFDDTSLFSTNSDTTTDSISNFSYDSRDFDQSVSSNFEESMTYDTPKPSRANSIVSTMSYPEIPERRKKREVEVMRQNSLYENWTLPFSSSSSNSNVSSAMEDMRPSKSTIYEFDPLNEKTSSVKYEGVSNELLLLESFLIGDTYGTIVSNDSQEESFDFNECEYFNPPTPPERFDSLLNVANSSTSEKDGKSNWFVTENDSKSVTDDVTKQSNSVIQRFSRKLKFDNVLNKTSKQNTLKIEVIERPSVNNQPVPYFYGMLTKIVSGVVDDLFKNSQTRYCVLSDQKLMCYNDATNSVLKEAYTLDNVYSLQLVLPLSSR